MNPANLAPDLGTVIFLMLLSTTLVLGLNWRMHPRIAGTGPWFGAYLAFVSAAVALSLRRHVPELSSILVGNTLLTAGHLAMLWGACVFAGLEPPRRLVAALLLVAALGSLYFHVVTPSYAARWWLLGLIAAGASLYSLARPLRRLAQHDGLLGVGMYAGATVMSAALMLAVAAGLTWRETGVTQLQDASAYKAWGLALGTVFLAVQSFGVVLMTGNRLQRELQRQALADPLTGLPNRRAFDDALHRSLEGSARSGRRVGLVLVDVDHFKTVNDTRGHAVGDAVLREVALRFVSTLRHADLAARVGGEEFAAILEDPEPAALQEIGERVRRSVGAAPVASFGGPIPVTVSVGVAHIVAGGEDALRALYRDADEALYAAKRSGRDRVVVHDPLRLGPAVAWHGALPAKL